MAILIQCLPGGGKTWLSGNLTDKGFRVLDTDSLWCKENGLEPTTDEFNDTVKQYSEDNVLDFIVTNCWIDQFVQHDCFFMFYPEWNTWLETLLTSRHDLVDYVGFGELKRWYEGYSTNPDAVVMGKGLYLSDYIDTFIDAFHKHKRQEVTHVP